MGINQKDIKLLWGRSGNRCAICHKELTQDKKAVSASFTLGEQAHIVGEKEGAARGKSLLDEAQRNSYHNLILLCPTHHTEIDENEQDWPIEKLHLTKSSHELWVSETLSETVNHIALANQLILTTIIDTAVKKCCLETWQNWTSWALAPQPSWAKELPDDIFEFREKVISAIWPKDMPEFEVATVNFSKKIHHAAQVFMENSILKDDVFTANRFYRNDGRYNPNYDEDLKRYNEWIDECSMTMYEATKAANWFAEVVRKYVNPSFFAEHGKFIVSQGPYMDGSYRTILLEYTKEEKEALQT